MCYAYFESHVQAKVDQQDFYHYKTLQMRTIHDFEPIQHKQVECPLFLVLSGRSLSMSSRTIKGMPSISFRSKEVGVVYVYQALKSGYPFQSLALLLRLYTSRNPSLGGNRLGMAP